MLQACVPDVEAADGRDPAPKGGSTEEIRQLETQMEALEAQLDAIYEMLDDYTINSAPPEVLAERQRVENQLQDLHDRRTQALRQQRRVPTVAARPAVEAARPQGMRRRKPLANSIVKIGNDLVVRADEIVNGDAIVLGGNLRVEGEVLGDVIVLAGDLEIARTARVGGQAFVVGGYHDISPGASIEEEPLALSFFPSRGGLRGGWSRSVTLLLDVLQLVFLLVLALFFLTLYRQRFARAQEYLETGRMRSFGLGVLLLTAGSFVASVVAMLLLVTFIGIPVALLLGALAALVLLAALFLGSMMLGRGVQAGLRLPQGPRIGYVLLGLLVILTPEMLGDALGTLDPWIDSTLDIVSGVLTLLALSFGLGALVLTRMGRSPVLELDGAGETPATTAAAAG